MPILKPIENPCHVCSGDYYLKGIKACIAMYLRVTKFSWLSSIEVKTCASNCDPEYVILKKDGAFTSIPAFHVYDEMWRSAMTQSPFVFKWENFCIHDDFDRNYLKLVHASLEEACLLWTDEESKTHPVYTNFNDFANSVRLLYAYTFRDEKENV